MSEIINSVFERINVEISEEIERNIKLLYVFKDYKKQINVILISNEDKVYCCGGNDCGVLGFGHENNVKEFTINKELTNKRIIDFKSSHKHTIERDSDGKLYCWGRNSLLGNGKEDHKISKPNLNKHLINENIIDNCSGRVHTLVLTSNYEVYAWGWNEKGQIGNKSYGKYVSKPYKLNDFNGEKVIAICCGSSHSMALTEIGCVYSWGNNRSGQLGINNGYRNENKPKRIQIEVEIKTISCGRYHSIMLSREGDIYVFGRNQYKQLGFKTKGEKQLTPIKLNHSEKFVEISSHYGYHISGALSENGLFYVWGKSEDEVIISEQKKTQFKSFDEIFIHYFKITYNTINRMKDFQNLFLLRNGKYENNFRETKPFSSGSFGVVFEVSDSLNSKKTFALKKIPLSDDQKDKLSKELNILMEMNNNYVVKCFDFWIEENYYLRLNENSSKKAFSDSKTSNLGSYVFDPYKPLLLHIQMELCYKNLKEIIVILINELNEKGTQLMTPFGYYILSELFKELVEGLNYLHSRNPPIIHRDLKPANILISYGSDGRFVKLADFGIAVIHDNQSQIQDTGNDKYMAPEVRESRHYDTKADIYSLGVITAELSSISHKKYPENISTKLREIKELINGMTTYIPNLRPTCDQILKRSHIWEINAKQLIYEKNIDFEIEVNSVEESFHSYFIQKKFENYKKTNSLIDNSIYSIYCIQFYSFISYIIFVELLFISFQFVGL